MDHTLTLEIVTPEKVALAAEAVDSVVLPAVDGELGVLPGHTPLLVTLAPGEVRVKRGGDVRAFAIGGGYADVRRGTVSVFAEAAELPHEIDAERARQALEKAKADMARRDVDTLTLAQAEAAARRALVRLKVSDMHRHERQPHAPHFEE